MVKEFRMPPLGQTTEELRILKWLKSEGDRVELGEELLQVETDKADLAVESYHAGILLKQVAAEGEVVEVGMLVAYVGDPGDEIPSQGAHPPTKEDSATLVQPPPPVRTVAAPAGSAEPGKMLASPAARQLARLHQIDLASVEGSGPGGRIEVEDVTRAMRGLN